MPAPDRQLIAHLNSLIKFKLTGINQYFLHARMLKHAGNVKLADYQYKASIDNMKHSDMLVEHVLSLGGLPNLQELGRLSIGEDAKSMLANDLALSDSLVAELKAAIAYCEGHPAEKAHFSTIGILRRILESQQEQCDFARTQLTSLSSQQKDCA